jgi:N6-adenosine-specific RNA methylase IME4
MLETNHIQMTINPKFKSLIPPLAEEEYKQLEANIIQHGCRDALTVWRGILIDGHNRFAICTEHNIEYRTQLIDLPDEEAVEDWMDANQLGRRNLTADAFKLLLGRRYNRTKKDYGGDRKSSGQNDHLPKTAETLGKQHGVSPSTVQRAGNFAKEVERTPELQKAIQQGKPVLQVKREIKEKKREQRREDNRRQILTVVDPIESIKNVATRFATIVIDPPWDWGDEGDGDQLGRAKPDYSTMSIADLMELPVADLADDDCHLYLWITNRSLPKGFALMERWGFRYITMITWVKPHYGMGNYFRGQTEHVLFAVKGSQPLKRKDLPTVFFADRGKGGHSSKPPEFFDLVASASPGPFLEMFSRTERPDWTTWGERSNDS